MTKNANLHNAKLAKNNEFYTQLTDIEKEMKYYRNEFEGKVVYCNCDDPRVSNFFKFFSLNFEFLGLKKLICTGYKAEGKGVAYIYTALDWISEGNIADYMGKHQHDATATELWSYFQNVISWVEDMFPTYRKEMQSVNWGELYNKYHTNKYNPTELENKVKELMANEEVTDKKGVYEFVLSGEDVNLANKLSKRLFSETDKRTAYERQKGVCPICGEHHEISEMHADHIIAWWKGGTTTLDNLQMVCKKCNLRKSGI